MAIKKSVLAGLAVLAVLLTLTLWRSLPKTGEPASTAAAVPEESAYVLREYDGCVAIFRGGENSAPASVTDIEVRLLPACDRELLSAGIGVSGSAELCMLLEDLGS